MLSKYIHIQHILSRLKVPNYRYKQLLYSLFRQKIGTFEQMTLLPKNIRDTLSMEIWESILNLQAIKTQSSTQVKKILFHTSEHHPLEAMHLQYKENWSSFCISSQCGCGYACSFCATGKLGFLKNLSPDEISDQLLYFLLQGANIDSVSFMGMGEPLANPYIFDTLELLTTPQFFGLSQRKITISTVGIIPKMYELSERFPQIHVTFSLHSPFSDQRSELMPINKVFPLHEVMKALDQHIITTRKKVYLAYVLLQGINDSSHHAQEIVTLIQKSKIPFLYHVDLIPYNSSKEKNYQKSNVLLQKNFVHILKKNWIPVTIRTQFGSDISAGCGQLHGE